VKNKLFKRRLQEFELFMMLDAGFWMLEMAIT
jgi:hypothetical protein